MTAEWVRVDLDAVGKYGADAAVVLGLIAYRCNATGEWAATLETIWTETRLTPNRVRAALRVLRDTGAVTSYRADRFRPHLTWSVSAGHTVNVESTITRIGNPPSPENVESTITSYRENQELPLEVPTVEPAAPKRARRATSYPSDFRPKDSHWALAQRLGVDLRTEGPKFQDHHLAKGSTFKDWDRALNTWIRNAATFAARSGGGPATTQQAGAQGWVGENGEVVYLAPPKTDAFA